MVPRLIALLAHSRAILLHPSLAPFRPVDLPDLVRVGRDHDGGYVLPLAVLAKSGSLLSLGVNDDWSFEAGVLSHNPAVRLTCVDGTTGLARVVKKAAQKSVDMVGYFFSLQWQKLGRNARYLSRPYGFHRFFSRHELVMKMVGARDDDRTVTLASLLNTVRGNATRGGRAEWIILKIDIEGSEYDILPCPPDELRDVSVILVEFHELDRNWEKFERVVQSLGQSFYLAHLHGNNFQSVIPGTAVPVAMEMTFVNKALVEGTPPASLHGYPRVGLDMANNWQRADLSISFE